GRVGRRAGRAAPLRAGARRAGACRAPRRLRPSSGGRRRGAALPGLAGRDGRRRRRGRAAAHRRPLPVRHRTPGHRRRVRDRNPPRDRLARAEDRRHRRGARRTGTRRVREGGLGDRRTRPTDCHSGTGAQRRRGLMSDGIIAISDTFLPTLKDVPRDVAGQVTSTLDTLRTTPESPGLHVEPIQNAKDDRIRSVRVNRKYRLLVFRLNSSGQNMWLVEGIYNHDDAYDKAITLYLRMNPVSGTTEIRSDEDALQIRTGYSEEEVRSRAAALAEQLAAERIAAREAEAAAQAEAEDDAVAEVPAAEPSGPVLGLTAQQLIDELGLDRKLAERAAEADDAELWALAGTTKGWQGTALLDLATGTSLEDVRAAYFTGVTGGSA